MSLSNITGAIFICNYTKSADFTFPGIVLHPDDDIKVIECAKSISRLMARIRFQQTFLAMKPAPVVAAYSSKGSSQRYPGVVKPEVLAPSSSVGSFGTYSTCGEIGSSYFCQVITTLNPGHPWPALMHLTWPPS